MLLLLLLLPQENAVEEGKSRHRPLVLEGAPDDLRALLAEHEIADRDFPWTLSKKRETAKLVEYELTFPSPLKTDVEENNTVPCKVWMPKDDQKRRPAAVMLHWLGGSFDILEAVCARMAERGITTLMLWMPTYGKRRAKDPAKRTKMISLDNERTLLLFKQAMLDIRRAGDWLASRRDVEPSRVGLVGISLGAVVGAVVSGIDLNFRRVAFLVGGGDLPGVVLHGSKETAEIKKLAEEKGLGRDELAKLWRPIEPLTYASRLRTDRVLMLNAESDQVFPRACTDKLWEACGKPEIVWYKADHYTWAMALPKILDALEKHLEKVETYAAPAEPVAGAPLIRVLLKENAAEVGLEFAGAVDVRRPGAADPLAKGVRFGACAARAVEGVTVGDRAFREPWIVLESSEPFKFGGRAYEGSVHLVASRAGGLHVVNEVDLERYVAGVVGPEIGPKSPMEALKAQAVCARTYAYVSWVDVAKSAQRQVFDVYDDVRDQVYRGMPEKGSDVDKAVAATAGRVVTWKEKPFKAFFSSTCGGQTESGAEVFGADIAPLAGAKCGSCGHAKHFAWTLRMKPADLSAALGFAVKDVAVASSTRGGRAARVAVTRGDGTEVLVAGPEFRKTVGYDKFRSTLFTVAREGDEFVFKGNGWGHGVGLCQEGAIGMARDGGGWEAILQRYYPGATLKGMY